MMPALIPFKQGAEARDIQAECSGDDTTMNFVVKDGNRTKSITLDTGRGTAVMKTW